MAKRCEDCGGRAGEHESGKDCATDMLIQDARSAERRLAEIARTRRPTEAESAAALTAYAAAAKVMP